MEFFSQEYRSGLPFPSPKGKITSSQMVANARLGHDGERRTYSYPQFSYFRHMLPRFLNYISEIPRGTKYY